MGVIGEERGARRGAGLAIAVAVTLVAAVIALVPTAPAAAADNAPRVLLVGANTRPTPPDAALRDVMEAAGYEVVLADDNAVGAGSVEGFDVVFVSSSIKPFVVKAKLRDVTVPVVNTEPFLHDDFKMTANLAAHRGETGAFTQVTIVDDSHPMAAGLDGTVTTNTDATGFSFGRPVAAAQVIATLPGSADQAAIFAFDAGDSLNGISAPARRVGLFLSYDTPRTLTDDGAALVVAALDWARGDVTDPPDPPDPPDPTNVAPTVDAGPDRSVVFPAQVTLTAAVTDDGLPTGTVTVAWQQTSGPAVSLAGADSPTATAELTAEGVYEFEATADDGQLRATDRVTVTARPPASGARVGGAVALYDLGVGDGTVVADQSGQSPAVDLHVDDPDATVFVPGIGFVFDGSSGLTSPEAAARLTTAARTTNQVTLEAWVTPADPSPPGPGVIASLGSSASNRNVTLSQGYYPSGPKHRFEGRLQSGTRLNVADTAKNSVATELTHLVVRRGADRALTIFVDGVAVDTTATWGDLSQWSTGHPFVVGADPYQARGFRGTIHLVAMYDRALSDAEVTQNYDAGPSIEPDETPPVLSTPVTDTATTAASVQISADERVTVDVTVATGGSTVGVTSSPAGLATDHEVIIEGLSPATTYSLTIDATDAAGNVTTVAVEVTTTAAGAVDTTFDLWYGDDLRFGHLGLPQRWVNVLGTVADPDGVASASYRLGSGPSITMGLGPDNRRLVAPRDFNIDLLVDDLAAGANTVTITVIDELGTPATAEVTVTWQPGVAWSMPYTVDWRTVDSIADAAQVSDGRWVLDRDAGVIGLPDGAAGYDRIVAIGDLAWTDYEVTTTVTVHDIVDEPGPLSADPGFGFLVHWNGHNDSVAPGSQPHQGFRPDPDGNDPTPFGAITWWRNGRVRVMDHRVQKVKAGAAVAVTEGSSWNLKMLVVTPGSRARYRMKMWPVSGAEPGNWQVDWTSSGLADEPGAGSVGLVAHEVQLDFGAVTVNPVS